MPIDMIFTDTIFTDTKLKIVKKINKRHNSFL